MVGQRRFAAENSLLNARLAGPRPVIAAHRGVGHGSVVENTTAAVTAAVASGADLVEIDVVASTDGDVFVFHDGTEPRHLGTTTNLATLSTAQIEAARYLVRGRRGEVQRVERLAGLLAAVPRDVLLNVDRSWDHWPAVLDELAAAGAPERFLVKCVPTRQRIEALAAHGTKFPFLPIVTSVAQVQELVDLPELNTVGAELICAEPDGGLLDAATIAHLHSLGLFCLANAEVLGEAEDLAGGFDDAVSVLSSPEAGWGTLVDRGIDVVLTDWPWLLRDYRDARTRRR